MPAWLWLLLPATALAQPPNEDRFLPYQAWHEGDALLSPRQEPNDTPGPLLPGKSYDRRPFQLYLGGAMLPIACFRAQAWCGGSSVFAGFAHRLVPHFAWTFGAEYTRARPDDVVYAFAGARVFALESGRVDPYAELNLGAEHWSRPGRINLAGEIAFGVAIHVFEHLELGPVVKFRQGETRLGVCRWDACNTRSAIGERWLAAGLSLLVPLGAPH